MILPFPYVAVRNLQDIIKVGDDVRCTRIENLEYPNISNYISCTVIYTPSSSELVWDKDIATGVCYACDKKRLRLFQASLSKTFSLPPSFDLPLSLL